MRRHALLLALPPALRGAYQSPCPAASTSCCASHDDCDGANYPDDGMMDGYCRVYSSNNYCRACGACRYDGAPWPADPLGGACPAKCDALPRLRRAASNV